MTSTSRNSVSLRDLLTPHFFGQQINGIIEAVILSAVGSLSGTLIGTLTLLKTNVLLTAMTIAASVSSGIDLFFSVIPALRAATKPDCGEKYLRYRHDYKFYCSSEY